MLKASNGNLLVASEETDQSSIRRGNGRFRAGGGPGGGGGKSRRACYTDRAGNLLVASFETDR